MWRFVLYLAMSCAFQQYPDAYDAWEHLCGDSFDDPNRGSIAVITAYFDASYNQPKAESTDSPVYTVACYFATKQNWDKFRREWTSEFKRIGLPNNFHFHMNKFEYARSEVIAGRGLRSDNPYHGWSKTDFDRFLDRLHRVINRRAQNGKPRLGPFQVGVIRPDFDEARPDELKTDPECRSYYMLCVSTIMDAIRQWADENDYYYPVHYIFAGGDKEGGNLDRWFDYCWKYPELRHNFRLGKGYSRVPHSIQWAAAEPALQAADIAAYELNKASIKWIERGLQPTPVSEMRAALRSLVRIEHFGWLWTKPQLAAFFAGVPANRKLYPL